MTTIAYHHDTKTIAYDSRLTAGSHIASDNIDKRHGFWFVTGSVCDIEQFIEEYDGNRSKASYEWDCKAFLVEDGQVYYISLDGLSYTKTLLTFSDAIGSGCDHAVAAMACGKFAVEAVMIAAMFDSHTGGEINTFVIGK